MTTTALYQDFRQHHDIVDQRRKMSTLCRTIRMGNHSIGPICPGHAICSMLCNGYGLFEHENGCCNVLEKTIACPLWTINGLSMTSTTENIAAHTII